VPTSRIVAEGRADRIDARGRELVVVDYKTGRPPAPDDAARSPALALYALAARHTLRRPCRRVELHHLPTGTVTAATLDEPALRAHLDRAEDAAQESAAAAAALAAGGGADALFPPSPAPRCGYCEVRRHCPEGRAAAPEEVPWASLTP
jgi:RecB family exonuclease